MSGRHCTIILDDGLRPIDTGVDVGAALRELEREVAALPSVTLERILRREPAQDYRTNPAPALRVARAVLKARVAEAERSLRDRAFTTGAQVAARRRWIQL